MRGPSRAANGLLDVTARDIEHTKAAKNVFSRRIRAIHDEEVSPDEGCPMLGGILSFKLLPSEATCRVGVEDIIRAINGKIFQGREDSIGSHEFDRACTK